MSTRAHALAYVLALALLLRLLPFALAVSDPARFFTLDAQQYIALAHDLHAGYFDPHSGLFALGLSRTPGYPVFAGACLRSSGGSVVAVILAQIALSVANVALAFALVRRLDEAAAAFAATVVAVDPATILYTNFLQPETLFTFLLLLTTLAWWRALADNDAAGAAAAGSLAALGALTRPVALFLPAALALAAAAANARARRETARLIAVALASFALIVGAWMARNASYTGMPLFSTIGGVNLLYYRAAGALATDEGGTIEDARRRLLDELATRLPAGANDAVRNQFEARLAFQVLRQHPKGALRSAAAGALRLASGIGSTALSNLRGDPNPEQLDGVGEYAIAAALTSILIGIYATAIVGLRDLVERRARAALAFALTFIAYFVLMSAGPEANTRFRVPLLPFLALLSGAGLARLAAPPARRTTS